jgi:type VI protein secretion system component VasK
MNFIIDTDSLSKQLRELITFLKYSTRETLFLFFAVALFHVASWFKKVDLKELPFLVPWQLYIFLGLRVIAGCFVIYVSYRFWRKIALVRPPSDNPLANSIKGLTAFTDNAEDGDLFRHLERDRELAELQRYINNSQIPFVVVMGESGAGKTSLLRAGLSYLLKDSETKYIYWEALPRDAVGD